MTYSEEIEEGEEEEEGKEKPRYHIDLGWYEQNQRSFAVLVESRMCPSCRARLREKQEERAATGGGRGTGSRKTKGKADDPLTTIQTCCSTREGYITPRLPSLEAVFRVFLATGNKPLDVDGIREGLDELAGEAGVYFDVTGEALQRLLDNDDFYGLQRIAPGE